MVRNLTSQLCCQMFIGGLCLLACGAPSPVQAEDWKRDHASTPGFQTTGPWWGDPQAGPLGIPAEFEQQAALVLSWKSEEVPIIGTMLEIGQIASKQAPLIVLVSSPAEREHAELAFETANINPRQVRFLEAPVDTIWARDFGPVVVRNADGSAHFVDSDYDDGDRPQDDNIPPVLATAMGAKCVRSLLTIEGGNLLSNGSGLCLTTSKTVADNIIRGYEHRQIQPLVKKMFQCQDVVVLEPLVGEPTGHVDMFATFTGQNTVVVASIDPVRDPINAAVLDRNAQKLAGYPTPNGPLQVERIPMPVQEEGLWRSFTNVLFFNGIVMMPTYQGVDDRMHRDAADVYRRLLPGWSVEGIDCTKLIRLGGAIHCVTLNIPDLKAAPKRQLQHARQAPRFPASAPVEFDERYEDREETDGPPIMFSTDDAAADSYNPYVTDSRLAHPFESQSRYHRGREGYEAADFVRQPMFDHPDRTPFLPDGEED